MFDFIGQARFAPPLVGRPGYVLRRGTRSGVAEIAQLRLPVLRRRAALRQGSGRINLKVWKGSEKTVKAGFTRDFVLAVPKGYGPRVKAELVSRQPLIAPVTQGQVVGTMKVSLDDKPMGDYPVVAIEAVPVAGIFGRAIDTVRLWFN